MGLQTGMAAKKICGYRALKDKQQESPREANAFWEPPRNIHADQRKPKHNHRGMKTGIDAQSGGCDATEIEW